QDGGAGHIQSLVLGGVLVVIGLTTLLIGLLADLINFNRQLLETTLEKVRRLELMLGPLPQSTAGDRGVAAQLRDIESRLADWPAETRGPPPPSEASPDAAPERPTRRAARSRG
ncbi:MAG: hypothetical protein MI920_13670, partial [Kiloniellales bacterium]|nr:hypothetical protein [Kiloniellales bacterium]